MTEAQSEKLNTWAIVDLFGHSQIAGRVSDVLIAGAPFLRVDVPDVGDTPEYTRYYHPNAIYSIAPVAEEVARAKAVHLQARPVQVYELPKLAAGRRERYLCTGCGELAAAEPGELCPSCEADDEDDEPERTCRVCGCTDSTVCPGGCDWVERDLCSACAGKEN